MSIIGAIFLLFTLVEWIFGGGGAHNGDMFFFFGVPFFVSCLISDAGMAAGMTGIAKMTDAGENAIIEARIIWRNRR